MKETKRTISVDRQALYEEIWGKSLHKTALKYNTTDNKLKEACVAARIPLPTQSYWSKKHMGIDVSSEIIPLPASNESVVEIISTPSFAASIPSSKVEISAIATFLLI